MRTGTDLVASAASHLGEPYVLGAFAPKNNANWKGPWDCAEFASWLVYQETGNLVGCTNNLGNPALADAYSGAWARDARLCHRPLTIGQARGTAGAILIREPVGKAIGHVAISRGDGTTVEAHSRPRGVTNDKVDGRRWDFAMLAPGFDYPEELVSSVYSPPAGLVLALRQPPMRGALVGRLQEALKARGFDPGPVDNFFGPLTHAAVVAFQLSEGLVADGEAGPATLASLNVS